MHRLFCIPRLQTGTQTNIAATAATQMIPICLALGRRVCLFLENCISDNMLARRALICPCTFDTKIKT